jgi:RNA polymerase-binding transcription factor DksA
MDLLTRSRLDLLQDLLARRRLQLQTEIMLSQAVVRRPDAGEVGDWKDEAQRRQQAEVAEAEELRDAAELARVEQALARLRQGTYGVCLHCGRPIPWARLQVQPAAPCCAACQAEAEHAGPMPQAAFHGEWIPVRAEVA